MLERNTTTGIWITLSRDGSIVEQFRYKNGNLTYSRDDCMMISGAGVTGQVGAEGMTPDRHFSGAFYYNTR